MADANAKSEQVKGFFESYKDTLSVSTEGFFGLLCCITYSLGSAHDGALVGGYETDPEPDGEVRFRL